MSEAEQSPGLVRRAGREFGERARAGGARLIGIEHGDAIAHRLGCKTEHAAELAAAGRADVEAHHTWGHRAADLLALVRERTA